MRMNDIDYRDDTVICRGFIAYDDTASGKRPGMLVFDNLAVLISGWRLSSPSRGLGLRPRRRSWPNRKVFGK